MDMLENALRGHSPHWFRADSLKERYGTGSMVLDFAAALCYIGIVWTVGQWTAGRIFAGSHAKGACLLSFALGFSELTLLSTFLYFTCRMPVQGIRIVCIALGLVALADLVRRHGINKATLAVLFGVVGLWLVMLLPGLAGREQYYVYRGNCTDQQTYVEETVALSMHSLGWYESRSKEEIEAVSDVLWRGYCWAVKDRPSAGLMIAMMRANPSGEIYWVVYLYRMFVLAMTTGSLLYLFATVLRDKEEAGLFQKGLWGLAAALYCVGFWGQIQYDIDAVSQISSIAVLVALTAVFIRYAQELTEGQDVAKGQKNPWDRKMYLAMILLASGGLALYLESALVHGALYLVTGIALLMYGKAKLTGRQAVQLAGIPALSFGILVLANYRIVHFLSAQVNTSVSDVRQSWANYFNAWWLGRYGIDDGRITGLASGVANRILSISGMYNITPNYERYYGLAALALTGLAMFLALCILFCLVRFLMKKTGKPAWALWILTLTGIVAVLGMWAAGKAWSAGKLLYYISPYLYAFLCMPALQIRRCEGVAEKLALFVAAVLLLSNISMVTWRYNDMKVNWAGLGYRGNYPSDMIAGLKMGADFDFDTHQLAGYDGVRIEDLSMVSDSQFYLQYLKVKLTCAGIVWICENDMDYYQEPVEASQYRTLTGNVAVLCAVQDEDGRYGIEIRQ